MAEHDYDNPEPKANARFDPANFDIRNQESFEELPVVPAACVLYHCTFAMWLAIVLNVAVVWGVWLLMLLGHLHHYTGRLVGATSPFVICVWGMLALFLSIVSTPQTLIFRDGELTCTHIIGFQRLGIRRVISRQRIRGLYLAWVQGNTKSGGSYTGLELKWTGLGIPIPIGRYEDHDVCVVRAKYISRRTGLPLIGPEVRVVQPSKFTQTRVKPTK